MKNPPFVRIALCLFLMVSLSACTRYQRTVQPFKLPAGYPNMTVAGGAQIAAKAYDTPKAAEAAFGFDILGAGVLPVQVVFDHHGSHPLEIAPDRAFLVDVDDDLWPVLDSRWVYDRIERKTRFGEVASGGVAYGTLGGIAGGLIGAAIGIVSGHNVGDAAMKGAAAGAAGGAVLGGAAALDNTAVQRSIREDLQARAMQNRSIQPQEIAHGFLFFPGESKKRAKTLRITVVESDTGTAYPLSLDLQQVDP